MMEMLLRSEDKMICPTCSQPMIKGYVQSAREIFFTEYPHRVLFSPKNDEVSLSEKNNTAPTCPAWHCPMCRKVIIEYGKGQ